MSLVLAVLVSLAPRPCAAAYPDRLVLAPEVRVPLRDAGYELSFMHGLGVPAADSELLARLGLWLPSAKGQRLPALAIAFQWLASPLSTRLRPLVGVEFGGYLVLFEQLARVGASRVGSRAVWAWSVRGCAGLGLRVWGPVELRALADGEWVQGVESSPAPSLPRTGPGLLLQVVVAPPLPHEPVTDYLIKGVPREGAR